MYAAENDSCESERFDQRKEQVSFIFFFFFHLSNERKPRKHGKQLLKVM